MGKACQAWSASEFLLACNELNLGRVYQGEVSRSYSPSLSPHPPTPAGLFTVRSSSPNSSSMSPAMDSHSRERLSQIS